MGTYADCDIACDEMLKEAGLELSPLAFFDAFNIDCGRALLNVAKHERHINREHAKQLVKKARRLWGHDLWYFTPRQRMGGQAQDLAASEVDPLSVVGSPEREARLAHIAQCYQSGVNPWTGEPADTSMEGVDE